MGHDMAISVMAADYRGNPRHEHLFFSGIAILIVVAVFAGFASTFFLRGIVRVPRFVRISLLASHQVQMHRRLGRVGFVLACLLILAGVPAVCESLARYAPLGRSSTGAQARAIFPLAGIAIVILFGYYERRSTSVHERLMILARGSFRMQGWGRYLY